MREILFRGKDIISKQWREGYIIVNSDGKSYIKDSDYNVNNGKCDLIPYEVDPETVIQFTGLTDKNGVKIWEWDKVKYYQPYSKKWEEGFVKWDDLWACFGVYTSIGDEYCHENDWVKIQDIEVIGNIHDKKP